jgi:hypothetical protein
VIQTFQLTWKGIMLLLEQTLSSLERVQPTQVGNDHHLQWAPILVAPGNEGINVPTYRGTGSPLDRSTPKRGWWYGSSSRVLLCRPKVLGLSPSPKKKNIWG